MKSSHTLRVLAAACTFALASSSALAVQASGVTVDGTLDPAYGSAITTQTINTGFGDSTDGLGDSANGSELDAAYAYVNTTNYTLYLFFAGNSQNNGNHIDIFIDDGRGGVNTLPSASGGALGGMTGSTFSPNFNCTLAYDFNDYSNNLYLDTYNFINNSGGYQGNVQLSTPGTPPGGVGSGTLGGTAVGFNNQNAAGVNGVTGTAVTDPSIPNAVTTGLEIGIPLSALGSPSDTSIKVLADINGGNDGFLSNQFLPGLPVGTGNVGTAGGPYSGSTSGSFNLSSLSNEYFLVNIPFIPGVWTGADSSDWSDSKNWSGNTVPQNPGDPASFSQSGGGNVTVDGTFTVGTLSFNAPNASYTLSTKPDDAPNADTITLNNNGSDATITDYAGIHFIYPNLVLASNTDFLINNRNDSMFIYSNISGPGSLSSMNPGDGQGSILYLYGTNSYTGGTIIRQGTVELDSAGALPANSALTMDASDVPDPVLDLAGNSISLSSLTELTGPNTASTGAIAIIEDSGGAATITYNGASANPSTFGGNISDNSGGNVSLTVASGSLTLSGSNTLNATTTVSLGATLTLANTAGSALPNTSSIVNFGTVNIDDLEIFTNTSMDNSGTVNINAGGTFQIKAGNGNYTFPSGVNLTGGKIDTTDNALILPYTAGNDSIATVISEIQTAFDGGLWDGPGIFSSLIAANPGTALGYVDQTGSDDVLVKIAWLGDLNLDGTVDNTDLQTITANAGKTNATWSMGDLNYDRVINADDFSLFMYGAAESGGKALAVPEPASLALVSLPLLAFRRRRR